MSSAESSWSNMPRELENQKLKHPHSLAILAKNISRSLLSRENYILPLFPREAGGERQRRDGRTDGRTNGAGVAPFGGWEAQEPGNEALFAALRAFGSHPPALPSQTAPAPAKRGASPLRDGRERDANSLGKRGAIGREHPPKITGILLNGSEHFRMKRR